MSNQAIDLAMATVACVFALKIKNKNKNIRRMWTKEWMLKRQKFSHVYLLEELRLHPDDWRNYLRMDEDTYLKLLNMVTPILQRKDTIMRAAISVGESGGISTT